MVTTVNSSGAEVLEDVVWNQRAISSYLGKACCVFVRDTLTYRLDRAALARSNSAKLCCNGPVR